MSPGQEAYEAWCRRFIDQSPLSTRHPWAHLTGGEKACWEVAANAAGRRALDDTAKLAEEMGTATAFQLVWRAACRMGGVLDNIATGKDPDSGREYTAEELRALARKALGKP